MKDYQVIARRFRPKAFSEVVGQDVIVITLKNSLKLNTVGSAYLFCGPRGSGKTTLARILAKALNCERLTINMEPCNSCPSCLEILSGHSLNVLEIDGASNRGIDDIRQINETIHFAPSSGKYKIYLIDEVHMLTKEAFNALLKTLEEPPPHVKFFFATTEAHKVLPTITSRCQRFDLRSIPIPLITEKLRTIATTLDAKVEEGALTLIAEHASGALRDAESLLDQLLCYSEGNITLDKVASALGLVPKELFFQLDQAIHNHHLPFAFECAQTVIQAGSEVGHFLEGLMEHFRTILEILLGGTPSSEPYRKAATLYTKEQCLYLLDYLLHWSQEMARSPFKRVGLEVILLHLLRTRYRLAPDTLVQRLLALEVKESAPVTPPAPPIIAVEPDTPLPFEKKLPTKDQHTQTLLRFAAVELDGVYKP